jgi:predicted ATP-grasp superfamily ATP-dependent carboligase
MKRLLLDRDGFRLRPWWRAAAPAVIVQTYVHGRPANCAAVCSKGDVLAGAGVEVVSAQNPTGPATVVRVVENREMALAAARIASKTGISGFFGLDFVIEEKTGATYLIEMNPRCTPLCHLQLGPGRDMISALVARLQGAPMRETPPATENGLIAYFPRAWTFSQDLLPLCFQDVPQNEPELVEELLHPSKNQRFPLRRLWHRRTRKAAAGQTRFPHLAS